jgi:hypothetical protein
VANQPPISARSARTRLKRTEAAGVLFLVRSAGTSHLSKGPLDARTAASLFLSSPND